MLWLEVRPTRIHQDRCVEAEVSIEQTPGGGCDGELEGPAPLCTNPIDLVQVLGWTRSWALPGR